MEGEDNLCVLISVGDKIDMTIPNKKFVQLQYVEVHRKVADIHSDICPLMRLRWLIRRCRRSRLVVEVLVTSASASASASAAAAGVAHAPASAETSACIVSVPLIGCGPAALQLWRC